MRCRSPPDHAWESWRELFPPPGDGPVGPVRLFFTSLGLLVFTPDAGAGALVFAIVAMRSRLLAIHGALAFAVAYAWTACVTPDAPVLAAASGFNFILVGFALGAFFLRASPGSAAWSVAGAGVCGFLVLALTPLAALAGSTPSTLPFNLAVLAVLAVVRGERSDLVPRFHRNTPEATLEAETVARARFGEGPALALPFTGTCRVYQAFDGPWTHQGEWRHGYDFIRCDRDGLSYRNSGAALDDYLLFGMELRAPCDGVVTTCRDDLDDNAPGTIDHVNNWGNLVVVRMLCGLHVQMGHLRRGSLRVKPGDAVRTGDVLAACGNSGYSLYPHLHMQVQCGPQPGEATLPFSFSQVVRDGRLYHAHLPEAGADVSPPVFPTDRPSLGFIPGDVVLWEDSRGEAQLWRVRRDDVGLRLEDALGVLRFASDPRGYVMLDYEGPRDTALASFARAVPRLPNCAGGAVWREAAPFAASGFWRRELRLLAAAAGIRNARLRTPYAAHRLSVDGTTLESRASCAPRVRVTFDADNRPVRIASAGRTFTRKSP